MKSLTLVFAGSLFLALAATSAAPVASAGCTIDQTCAWITGSSSCSSLTHTCSGTLMGRHSAPLGGVGTLSVNGVVVSVCPVPPGGVLSCTTTIALTWACSSPPTIVATTVEAVTGQTATDTDNEIGC